MAGKVIERPKLDVYEIELGDRKSVCIPKKLFNGEQKYKVIEIFKSNYPDEFIKDKKLNKLKEIIANDLLSNVIEDKDDEELKRLVEGYLYVLHYLGVINYNGKELGLPKLPDKVDDVHHLYIILYALKGNLNYLNKLNEIIKKSLSGRELTPQELNEWTDSVNNKIKNLGKKILQLATILREMKSSGNYDQRDIRALEQSYRVMKKTYYGYMESLKTRGRREAIQWLMEAAKVQLEKAQSDIVLAKLRIQDLINLIEYNIDSIVKLGGLPYDIVKVPLNIGDIAIDAVESTIAGEYTSIPNEELDRDIKELKRQLKLEAYTEQEEVSIESDQEKA